MLYNGGMATETRTRLNDAQRLRVLALAVRGDGSQAIADAIQETYGISITASGIDKIKATHADTLAAMKQQAVEAEAADAETLLARSRRMIGRKLTKAERDADALEKLDEDYRQGNMKLEEYRRKKTGLLNISIAELNAVTKEMYIQTGKGEDGTPRLPAGNLHQTEALLEAIKRGDTVELQRLIFRPNHDQPVTIQS